MYNTMRRLMWFLLLSGLRSVNAYFSYYVSISSDMNTIEDMIPQWAVSCFNKEFYRGELCSPIDHSPGCLMYVVCPNGVCTTDVIDGYHKFGENKNISGIVFSGGYPNNGTCRLPSTFIFPPWYDFETYVKNNNQAFLALKDPTKEDMRDIIIIHKFGILFIGISLCLIIFCMYVQTQRYRMEHRTQLVRILPETDQTETEQIIRVITDSQFDPEQGEAICPICIEPFEEGETVSTLSCGHRYKPLCIRDWLKKQTRCPLCNCEK